jgi:hypothetical protein
MGSSQKSIKLVWRYQQLLSWFLVNCYFPEYHVRRLIIWVKMISYRELY